jgi:hypothetical protein
MLQWKKDLKAVLDNPDYIEEKNRGNTERIDT